MRAPLFGLFLLFTASSCAEWRHRRGAELRAERAASRAEWEADARERSERDDYERRYQAALRAYCLEHPLECERSRQDAADRRERRRAATVRAIGDGFQSSPPVQQPQTMHCTPDFAGGVTCASRAGY